MPTNCGTVLSGPGFLPGLRGACTRHGTLLVADETHTQFDHHGGAVTHYGIAPDMATGGKGVSGGIPIGALGMTPDLADLVADQLADELGDTVGLALGGTLFANALSPACAETVLTELMTPAEHERIARLGERLADGIEAAARSRGLPWRAHRFDARSGYCLQPEPPRNAREAHAGLDPLFTDATGPLRQPRRPGRHRILRPARRIRPRHRRRRHLPRRPRHLPRRDVRGLGPAAHGGAVSRAPVARPVPRTAARPRGPGARTPHRSPPGR